LLGIWKMRNGKYKTRPYKPSVGHTRNQFA
jgi:hypothetical protein